MPLEGRNRRNIQEDIISGLKVKVWRSLDNKVDHLGGQDNAVGDVALALIGEGVVEAERLLDDEEAAGAYEPLPEVGGVEHHQRPEHKVQEVRPVEDLNRDKFFLLSDESVLGIQIISVAAFKHFLSLEPSGKIHLKLKTYDDDINCLNIYNF